MKSRTMFLVLAALIVISGLSYAGWRIVRQRDAHSCAACERPIHVATRTVARINGKDFGYCCPACALSQQRQTGTRVNIVSLTDYERGSQLEPERAYLVRGSAVNSCLRQVTALGADKHPAHSDFDRCSPSLLAFQRKEAAEQFSREHGGHVLLYKNLPSLPRR
jgi:hypothetical protein